MNTETFQIPTAVVENSARLHASLHLESFFVSIAFAQPEDGVVIFTHNQSFPIGESIPFAESVSWLQKHWPSAVFKKTILSVEPLAFNLIPKAMFQENEVANYLPQITQNEFLAYRFNTQQDVVVVFATHSSVVNLERIIAGVEILALPTLLLPGQRAHASLVQSKATLWVGKEKHYLCLEKNNALVLLNEYAGNTAEDILYFLANGCIQYGIDLAALPVFVQGTHFDSNYVEVFESYVRNVQFSENMQANSLNDLWKLHMLCA
jgi:hypothetical protein